MLRIPCPYCGTRDQDEFRCGGEAGVQPPADSSSVSDREWAEYLFVRDNICGAHFELWLHESGCKQWFRLLRNTLNHDILQAWRLDEPLAHGGQTASAEQRD